MFEQAVLAVQDEKTFREVHAALEAVFARHRVEGFLKTVQKNKLRARQFEEVLASGLLGAGTPAKYAALGDSDRGQVREQYLRMVEQVDPAIRTKFLKVYAYY
ncbi:MAG TPA: hypothetical protein VFW25_07335 [Silvibacterium sp.]|nr:hypothetical protein [Silvibacterium sp.]